MEIKRDANVISAKEFAAGRNKWPCVRCGRLEVEECNGMGTGDYCPNGRKRPDLLPLHLKEANKLRKDWNPTPYAREGAKPGSM